MSYGPEVDAALVVIWEALDYTCAERLQPNLVSTGELLAQHGALHWSPSLAAQLEKISISSVQRHLPPVPVTHRRRKPRAPENRHQRAISAYCIARDIPDPGHLEMDLVHHCGAATTGEYVYTLQIVDVATGWSYCRAILGHSHLVMRDVLVYVLPHLPFEVREVHPDNRPFSGSVSFSDRTAPNARRCTSSGLKSIPWNSDAPFTPTWTTFSLTRMRFPDRPRTSPKPWLTPTASRKRRQSRGLWARCPQSLLLRRRRYLLPERRRPDFGNIIFRPNRSPSVALSFDLTRES